MRVVHMATQVVLLLALICSLMASDADEHHKHAMGQLSSTKGQDGEQYAWRAYFYAGTYVKGYLVSKDEQWIINAIECYDMFLSKNKKDPDGYYGTFGAGLGDKKTKDFKYHHDTVVGDAIECIYVVKLAEIILNDKALEAKYGDKARYYVDYAEKMCWEKWNKRGCNYEDAFGFMSYHTYSKQMDPRTNTWGIETGVISDNLNKHYDMATVLLVLYRITGKKEYKEQAFKVYKRAKRMFRLLRDEDRIVWNFWMPHGPWDLKGTAPSSWVGVHSSRAGYQAGEVVQFIEAYDTGVVFNKEDFQRMIKTNLWMMDQGFKKSADGTSSAGTLWSAFGRFDDTIFKSATAKDPKAVKDRVNKAYLELTRKYGWERRYAKSKDDLMLYDDYEVQDGKHIALASVIPSTLETVNNDRVRIIAQLRETAPYKVELLTESGSLLGTLHEVEFKKGGSSYETIMWDGTNPKTGTIDHGTYTVRFTLGKEVRTWPVEVIKGTKKAKAEKFVLTQGSELNVDFESELDDTMWKLGGDAAVVDGKGVDGSKALVIAPSQGATLTFGEYDDLKVKVSFDIYDDGVKKGKASAGGGYWGMKQSNGNIFAIHRYWRKYLSGDVFYSWLNNGENQWFTAHQTNLQRKKGWRTFVFDFTGDGLATISCDGEPLDPKKMNPAKFIPQGIVGLNFSGPGHKMAPIYVDNIKITYP